jgi:putative phosphoesterase
VEIAVLSDIHGNQLALEAVLNDIDKHKIRQIIFLGDLITDLPQETNNVLNTIRAVGTYIIQGNREYSLMNKKEQFEYNQFLTTYLTFNQISDDNFEFITSLPEQISLIYDNIFSLRCIHATPFSLFDHIHENDNKVIVNSLNSINEKILLCGHTHRQWYKNINGKIILNPGSVGINFSGDQSAQYALLKYEHGKISCELKKIKYDFNAFKSMCDLSIPWVRLCVRGMEDGSEYTLRFLDEAKIRCNEWPIPNDVWDDLFKEWCEKKII